MTKLVNLESAIKKIYTQSEIRYAKAQSWTLVPSRTFKPGFPIDIDVKDHDGKILPAGIFIPHYYYTTTDWPISKKAECMKAIEKRAKTVRKQMEKKFSDRNSLVHSLDEWIKQEDDRIKREAVLKRNRKAINAMLSKDGMHDYWYIIHRLRLGENVGRIDAEYSTVNGVKVTEDHERYSYSCKYTKVIRNFTLLVRRGYHVFIIGGLITFINDATINRDGMACEWIEQGRVLSKVHTMKGYLVRGEHIQAKSLKEAKTINAEHRAMQLARLLSARSRAKNRTEQKANGTLRITFQDSLNAGNCRPGTQEFKHKYEAAIGHEAKSITIAELRKYGKKFGVEYYAEKAIQYVLKK